MTGADLHEPKGVAAATSNKVYLSNGAGSGTWTDITTAVAASIPQGHIDGLILSNNGSDPTNDIDITAGQAVDTTLATIMILGSAITKRSDVGWSVGTGNGGLDTGAVGNAWYHVWLIQRSDTSVEDVLFSLSSTAPTMPTSYDRKRKIGSFFRTGGAIKAFSQVGDEFLWLVPVLDLSSNNPGTAAVSTTLTVPTGFKVQAIGRAGLLSTGTDSIGIISSLDTTDAAASATLAPLADLYADATTNQPTFQNKMVRVNTSAQIRTRVTFSDAATTIYFVTEGWIDPRGRTL